MKDDYHLKGIYLDGNHLQTQCVELLLVFDGTGLKV